MAPNREVPHIRKLRTSDHEQVRALSAELTTGMPSWRSPLGQRAAVAGWVESAIAGSDGDSHAVFVAVVKGNLDECGDEVLGFASVTERVHFTGEREGYVGELAVAPGRRMRGIGRSLMAAAEDWARRRQLTRISLETGSQNTAARAVYARLGYLDEQVTVSKSLY